MIAGSCDRPAGPQPTGTQDQALAVNAVEAFLDELDRATGGPTEASQRNQRLYGVVGLGRASPLLGGLGSQLSAGTLDPALWPSLAALPRDRAARTVVTALATIDPELSLPADYAARWVVSRPRTLAQVAAIVARSHGTVLPSSPGRDPLEVALVRIRAQAMGLSAPAVGAPVPPGQLELTIDDPITQLMVAFAAAEGAALPTGTLPWTYRGRGGSARFQLLVALLGADPLVAELVDGLGRDLLGGLPDGEALLRVPPGAVAGETAIVGWRKGHPAARGTLTFVGPVVEMIPHGLAFASPGSLQLPYSQRLMARLGLPTTQVRLAGSQDGVSWQLLPSTGAAGLVTGAVEHFSFFAAVGESGAITYQSVLLPWISSPADLLDVGYAGPSESYAATTPYVLTAHGLDKLDWSAGDPLTPHPGGLDRPPDEQLAGAEQSAPDVVTTNGPDGGKLWRRGALGDWELLAGGGWYEEDVEEGRDAYFYDFGAVVQDGLGRIFVVETIGGDWDQLQRVSIRMIDGAAPHGVTTLLTGEPTWIGDGPGPAMDLRIAGAADLATGAVGVSATEVLFIADPGNDRVWAVNVDPREEPVDLGGLMLGPWEMVRVMGGSDPTPCIEGCYTRHLERYCLDPGYPDDTEDLGTYGLELVLRAPSGVAVADGDLVVSDLCKWRVVMAALQNTGVEPGTKEEPWLPTAFLSGDPHQDPPKDGRDPRSRLPGQLAWRDLQPVGVGQLAVRSACEDWAAPTCLQLICLQDSDCDGLRFHEDNCPTQWNPDQTDSDLDDYGAACDCNDGDPTVNPGALELCDGIDQNCDGSTDEGHPQEKWYRDADGDGYGASASEKLSCGQPLGYVSLPGDCLDDNEAVHPAAVEVCNGIDDDCDGEADEDLFSWYAPDADGDGAGDVLNLVWACTAPQDPAYVKVAAWDCNDSDSTIYFGAPDICEDNKDNDCNEDLNGGCCAVWHADGDGDGRPDACDNCPTVPNPWQENIDFDEFGDACDDDMDGDGVPNTLDGSPRDRTTDCGGLPTGSDADGDGVADACDNCPQVPNPDQKDNDRDGEGDACDPDDDNDGILDVNDNCPWRDNPYQEDTYPVGGDGVGDDCDRDQDGVPSPDDNCPDIANPDQRDTNQTWRGHRLSKGGDACDDLDSDLDGLSDSQEWLLGTDPAHPDTDGDGLSDGLEQELGTNPKAADTDGDGDEDGQQVDRNLLVPLAGWPTSGAPEGAVYNSIDPLYTAREVVLPSGATTPPSTDDLFTLMPTRLWRVGIELASSFAGEHGCTVVGEAAVVGSWGLLFAEVDAQGLPTPGPVLWPVRLDGDGQPIVTVTPPEQVATDCVWTAAAAAKAVVPWGDAAPLFAWNSPNPNKLTLSFNLEDFDGAGIHYSPADIGETEGGVVKTDLWGMHNWRNPALPCGDDPRTSDFDTTANPLVEFPIWELAKVDETTRKPKPFKVDVDFNQGLLDCNEQSFADGAARSLKGTFRFAPIYIDHPEDVEGGTQRKSTSQFVYTADKPGMLSIKHTVAAPADVSQNFLNASLQWTPPVIGVPNACGTSTTAEGEVIVCWSQDWDGDPGKGRGATTTATFTKLPLHNADFGKKQTRLSLANADYDKTLPGTGGPEFYEFAEVEYEVFFPRCGSPEETCTTYATNHPGSHRLLNADGCDSAVAGTGLPNWLYYWAQAVEVDGGTFLADWPYSYHPPDGDVLGEMPKVYRWSCWAGAAEETVFFGVIGAPGLNHPALAGLAGIDLLAATARHERAHAAQVRCFNACEHPDAGSVAPKYSAVPLADGVVKSGWSFRRSGADWNHYHDMDGDQVFLPPTDLTLDGDADDQCDQQYGLEATMPACQHAVCAVAFDKEYPVCDANVTDPTDDYESLSREVARAVQVGQFWAGDWASPGRQHGGELDED